MSSETRIITLQITYDAADYDPPSDWSWHMLLDLPQEDVEVINEYVGPHLREPCEVCGVPAGVPCLPDEDGE